MDQVKIGKFISDERKAKGYTQKQLSELLEISDKTISKWECENGFPEASLLLPLCNELEITVNELLTGERISQQNYKKKAEENMVNMIREKEENKQKILLTTIIGVISTITFVTLLLVVCFYTDVITLPIKIVLNKCIPILYCINVGVNNSLQFLHLKYPIFLSPHIATYNPTPNTLNAIIISTILIGNVITSV